MNALAQATKVKSAAAPTGTRAPGLLLPRRCACGGAVGPSGECEACRRKRLLQRRASAPLPAAVPAIVHDVLASPGRPLDAGARHFFEPRFGHDFSRVRVHDDARANASANAVNAHAFTVGDTIVFASGCYAPATDGGRDLLAHELAHTIQQEGLQRRSTAVALPTELEDHQLERHAEALAARALAGDRALVPAVAPVRPVLSRAAQPVPVGFAPIKPPPGTAALGAQAFEVQDAFPLPQEKGPVLEHWQRIATGGGLRASLELGRRPKVDLKQDRPELRAAWMDKMKWAKGTEDDKWSALAETVLPTKKPQNRKHREVFPCVNRVACHLDHIVELQVFGGNESENLQVLDPTPNMRSGNLIRQHLAKVAADLQAALGDATPKQAIFVWRKVTQEGGPLMGDCCKIEQLARAGAATAISPTDRTNLEGRPIHFLGKRAELLIDRQPKEDDVPLAASGLIENRTASRIIPGLSLTRYDPKATSNAISAVFDPRARLPVRLAAHKGKESKVRVDRRDDGALHVVPGGVNVPIHFARLSDGAITKVREENGEIAGDGYIVPSVPLLRAMGRLDFSFAPDRLTVTKALDPTKAKLPVPGFKLTKATLGLELHPGLKATGGIEFTSKVGPTPLLDGRLDFLVDEKGFAAQGVLAAHLPGVDRAQGEVSYRGGVWAGGVNVAAAQLKERFKYVTGGSLAINLGPEGVAVGGRVGLDLPYTKDVKLALELRPKGWRLTGAGTLVHPRLNPVGISIAYDGTTLEGTATPGPEFKLAGMKGGIDSLTVKFYEGKFSGSAGLHFAKGKQVRGSLKLNLHPSGKFSGKGAIAYQINAALRVSGAVVLDENEQLHLSGTLSYLKPIEVPHTKFGGQSKLFSAGLSLPIPGLSLGPAVGLKVRLAGDLNAGFAVGPAQLQNIVIKAAFNPFDDNPNPQIAGSARFYLPGIVHVGGSVSAAVVLDAWVAEVSGGLAVRMRADLDGHFQTDLQITFSPDRYTIDANFELMLALAILTGLDAFLAARAGFGSFSAATRKTWVLGEKQFDTGLKFGARAPLHYASDEPFRPPSWSSVQFIKPPLDLAALLARAFAGAATQEQKES